MNIRLLLTATAALACSMAYTQNRSIHFDHGTWTELQAKARKEHKLIFVDAYTTWCGPCKQMAKQVFTNDTAADFYNANFINAKIDMEKGEGPELARQYQVNCYPTLLFIDGDGKLAHRTSGSMPVNDFVALGKTARDATRNFSWYVTHYEERKTDAAFLTAYIDAIAGTCLSADKELAQYFSLQSDDDLWSDANWRMINDYSNQLDAREFKFLVANKARFAGIHGQDAVNGKIADVAASTLRQLVRSNPFDQSAYERSKDQIRQLGVAGADQVIFESDLALLKSTENWNGFAELALKQVDVFYGSNADDLNSIAWDFYEHLSDKPALLKAEAWAKRSVELETSYANFDTYAALLYKNGKKQDALATANKAIDYAKKENYSAEDYQATKDLITKIKAMK